MILVTGATGNVSGELARTLADAASGCGPWPAPVASQRSRGRWTRWPGT